MSANCLACDNGNRLPNGWQCDVCGRITHDSRPAPCSADITTLPTEFWGCTWDDGWEFEAPCVIYYPKKYRTFSHGGNSGELESMVEDIAMNIMLGMAINDGGLKTECGWRGWSERGFARRRAAWHVVIKGKWVMTDEGPEWQQTSRKGTYGCPPNNH